MATLHMCINEYIFLSMLAVSENNYQVSYVVK